MDSCYLYCIFHILMFSLDLTYPLFCVLTLDTSLVTYPKVLLSDFNQIIIIHSLFSFKVVRLGSSFEPWCIIDFPFLNGLNLISFLLFSLFSPSLFLFKPQLTFSIFFIDNLRVFII